MKTAKTTISAIAVELGRRGGLKTLKNKGKEHYRKMAQKRWANKKLSTGQGLTKQAAGV
jgi:hypothetical protein